MGVLPRIGAGCSNPWKFVGRNSWIIGNMLCKKTHNDTDSPSLDLWGLEVGTVPGSRIPRSAEKPHPKSYFIRKFSQSQQGGVLWCDCWSNQSSLPADASLEHIKNACTATLPLGRKQQRDP